MKKKSFATRLTTMKITKKFQFQLSHFFFFHLQIEDEGKHGNDDTRMFVLSSLAAHKKTHMACILCKEMMMVYDRYPLIDGTFFLSPIQHSKDCIEVNINFFILRLCSFLNEFLAFFYSKSIINQKFPIITSNLNYNSLSFSQIYEILK